LIHDVEERLMNFYRYFTNYYYGPINYVEQLLAHHFASIPLCLLGDAGTGKTLLAELLYYLHDKNIARIFYFKAREDIDKFLATINLKKLQELGRVDRAIEFILPKSLRLLVIDEWLRGMRETLQALLQITEEKSFNYGTARISWKDLSIILTANPIEKSPDIIIPPEHLLNRINNIWIPTLGLNWQILWRPSKHTEIIENAKEFVREIGPVTSEELDEYSTLIRNVEVNRDLELIMKTAVRAVTFCKFSETREASTMTEKPCDRCNFKPICSRVISAPSGWRLLRNTYHVAKALAFVRFRNEVTEKDVRDALFASLFYKVKLNIDLLGVYDEVSAMIKFVDLLMNDVIEAWEILRQTYMAPNYDKAFEKYIDTLIYNKPIPTPIKEMLDSKPYMEDVIIGLTNTLNEKASRLLFDAYYNMSKGDLDKALKLFARARIILRRRVYPFEYELEQYLIKKVNSGEVKDREILHAYKVITGASND
jgi:MoxR-like ATPase